MSNDFIITNHARPLRLTRGLAYLLGLITVLLFAYSIAFAEHASQQVPFSNAVAPANDPPQSFRALAYHDIRDNLDQAFKDIPDPTTVGTQELIKHFNWLRENGYHPVSLQQIIDARAGRSRLPDKAVLLTFDDGYQSLYNTVFPLLKLFNFPAIVAIVGSWTNAEPGELVQYGEKKISRDHFASWDELRTMANSGLVEIASHSYDLHKGIPANPQGSLLPAAVARRYDAKDSRYETDAEFATRIKSDLQRNSDLIERKLGKRPRALVWPYGRYNQEVIGWAKAVGMPTTINLDLGPNLPTDSTTDPLSQIKRTLVSFDTKLPDFIQLLHTPMGYTGHEPPLERVVHIDLDYIYDIDPARQEENLSKLLDRIQRLKPTTIYLQAFADPDGDGVADAVYFPNRHIPMRADLFSRVAWQLSSRDGVKVYAWMPVMAFKLPAAHPAATHVVKVMEGAPVEAFHNRYHRLSIFDPLVRKTILEIYQDLGKSAIFGGVLFHDDATLSDYEDASASALEYYRAQWQLPDSVATIRSSEHTRADWTRKKTAYITEFTHALADQLRTYQPTLLTARNLYAQVVLDPSSEAWFSQNFSDFLANYDFTTIMAMPYMEGAAKPDVWLDNLFQTISSTPGVLNESVLSESVLSKTVFELQSRDWLSKQPIPAQELAAQMRRLHLKGVRNFGYYPDDFHINMPDEHVIKYVISVETNLPERE